MRKNIFNTVAGLLVAVSMLFAAIGCTNVNDPETLKKDNFTVNKMAITGFKVTGLNGNYDHSTIELVVVKGDTKSVVASGIIADDANDQAPGSAYVKLSTPYIFDAGEHSPVDFQCYLNVKEVGEKILAPSEDDPTVGAPAKLPIIASPYGTKDADLAKRFVNVTVLNGTGVFEFVEEANANIRFSYTSLGGYSWDEILEADWATVTSVPKTDATYAKYKITVNNLKNDPDGMRYVVAGETIGSTKDVAGAHWNGYADNNADEGLISEVKDGSVEFNFIGTQPGWSTQGTAIKIAAIDDPMKSDPWLCLLTGPGGGNFFLPADKDYTIVIDAEQAQAEYKATVIGDRLFKIAGIEVISNKIDGSADVYFLNECLPGHDWSEKSLNKVAKESIDGNTASIEFATPIKIWAGEENTIKSLPSVQVIQYKNKDNFWAAENKVVEDGVTIRGELDEFIGKTYTLVIDMTGSEPAVSLRVCPVTIKAVRVINADVKDGTKIYFLDGDLIGSSTWNETETTTATMTDGKATYTLASPKVMATEKFGCQIVYIKEGETTFGTDWVNVIKLADDQKVDNAFDNQEYVLEFDASTYTYTLKAE